MWGEMERKERERGTGKWEGMKLQHWVVFRVCVLSEIQHWLNSARLYFSPHTHKWSETLSVYISLGSVHFFLHYILAVISLIYAKKIKSFCVFTFNVFRIWAYWTMWLLLWRRRKKKVFRTHTSTHIHIDSLAEGSESKVKTCGFAWANG